MEMTIQQFLVWLAGAGCVIAASWILERIPKYVALAAQAKMWIFFAVSVVIGAGAFAVGKYVPTQVLIDIAPYFAIIASVFSYVWLGGQFHQVDKRYTEAREKESKG